MGMGPAPAENHRHRIKDPFEEHKQTVPADAKVTAPKLPNATKYLKQTRDWYATWTKAPQASTFLATDWQRLHMLAPIVDAYWRETPGTTKAIKLMAEVRISEASLGATHLDRLRGRIKVERPGAGGSKGGPAAGASGRGVTDLQAQRRKRLAGGETGAS